jgi:hypothetical protein
MSKRNGDSISLHPKYGLNPSVGMCFWCGEDTGEILLYGNHIKTEAPMRSVASYAPCEKCAAKWEQGFVFIEADTQPLAEGQPEISPGAYPTGNYAVINPEAAVKIMGLERSRQGASLISREQFKLLTEKTSAELPNDDG